MVKNIKIAYLVENNSFDPWFIGTEYCKIVIKKEKKMSQSSEPGLRNRLTLISKE
jgi:hypothetical protein